MAEIPVVQVRRPPSPAVLVLSMAVTGLVSGVILVGVYLGTAPRIARNQAEAMLAAVFRVLPGTVKVVIHEMRDGVPRPYDGPQGTLPRGEALFAGYDADAKPTGFAVPAEGSGFMDTIKLIYGYDPARRTIVGMEVVDSRETPGLGDKIHFDPDFLANFRALAVEPKVVPVKKGKKAKLNEVDCITGATISSEAVVKILNTSTQRWLPILEGMPGAGGEERDGRRAAR